MSLETLTDTIRGRLSAIPHFGHTVLFDLGADGEIFLDGIASPPTVSNERREAETTLTLSPTVLQALLDGSRSATIAYMIGDLRIAGSMGVALKLNSLFEE